MRTRLRVTGAVMVLGSAFALLPLWAAHAEPAAGAVTVSLPARIVLDGTPVRVAVATDGARTSPDVVAVGLYEHGAVAAMGGVRAGAAGPVGPGALVPGTITARPSLVTAPCAHPASADACPADADGTHYRVVVGLREHASAGAVAKYGSKVVLKARSTATTVRWRAHVRRYDGSAWVDWAAADVRIGSRTAVTDAHGVATITTRAGRAHALTAAVAGTATVWPAASRTVRSSGLPSTALTPTEQKAFAQRVLAASR